MRYEFWLALRYLFAKHRERFISISAVLSIGGVALGVAALITILAVMSGFRHDYTEKFVGINAHLLVTTSEGIPQGDVAPLVQQLSSLEHVVGVSPFITGQALVRMPEQPLGILVRGIDPEREPSVSRLQHYLIAGTLPADERQVVIGNQLSGFLRAGLGDRLVLTSPLDGRAHELTISGMFRSGMYESDAFLVVVHLARAQQLYQLKDRVHGVSVRLDALERSVVVQEAARHLLSPRYVVRTWMELNPALFGALRVEKVVMFVIAALIILVAALNIMSMLTMIVMEKTREIGILRALGATQGSVARLFLAQGCIVGLVGIGLGLAGGLALTLNLTNLVRWVEATFSVSLFPADIYYLDYLPTQINSSDVTAVVTAAFALAVLAGTYAAIRAARLVPVDALRYE